MRQLKPIKIISLKSMPSNKRYKLDLELLNGYVSNINNLIKENQFDLASKEVEKIIFTAEELKVFFDQEHIRQQNKVESIQQQLKEAQQRIVELEKKLRGN